MLMHYIIQMHTCTKKKKLKTRVPGIIIPTNNMPGTKNKKNKTII